MTRRGGRRDPTKSHQKKRGGDKQMKGSERPPKKLLGKLMKNTKRVNENGAEAAATRIPGHRANRARGTGHV